MENNNNSRMVTGMFRDRESAERAYDALEEKGYTKDQINVMMSDDTRKKYFSEDDDSDLGNKAMEGAGTGSAIGGTVGAVAGIIAAGLAGAGAGGITGGLIGALIGSGVPKEHATEYENGIKNGHIVMGVKPNTAEDADYISNHWRNNNGESIYK
jgi:uncharacterized membrane protein